MKKFSIADCVEHAKSFGGLCLDSIYTNTITKMNWQCKVGHNFKAIFKTVKKGHWCAECAGVKKLTHSFVADFIKEKGGLILSQYINSGESIKIQCNKDNHIWLSNWDRVKSGHWCPMCAGNMKVPIEYICDFAKTKDGSIVDSRAYKNAKSKITVKCHKDNHIWDTTWDYLKQGIWCPKCAGRILLTATELKEYIINKNGVALDIPVNIKHDVKIKIQCDKDNHIWNPTYFSLIYNGSWCPKCSGKVLKTIGEIKLVVEAQGGQLLSAANDVKNNKSKLEVVCENNHTWLISYANLVNGGKWCPQCRNSVQQRKIMQIINEIFNIESIINYKGFDWLKNKNRLEIDIWAPTIKLAIEYDGVHHFKAINYNNDINLAKKRLAHRKKLDKLKNKLIKEHDEEIKYFIRFNYTDKITKDNIVAKLKLYKVPLKTMDIK